MDLSQYAELFLAESREHLSACNHLLLEWERAPANLAPVSGLFRAVHTVKGMAATMGYARVTDLAHRTENLLDLLRRGAVGGGPRAGARRHGHRRRSRGRRHCARGARAIGAERRAAGRGPGAARDRGALGAGDVAPRGPAQGRACAARLETGAGARGGRARHAARNGVRGRRLRRAVQLPDRLTRPGRGDRDGSAAGGRRGARERAGRGAGRPRAPGPRCGGGGGSGRVEWTGNGWNGGRGGGGARGARKEPAYPRGPAAARRPDGPDRRARHRTRSPERARGRAPRSGDRRRRDPSLGAVGGAPGRDHSGAHDARLAGVRLFFFDDTATTEIYTLSLHDALPI